MSVFSESVGSIIRKYGQDLFLVSPNGERRQVIAFFQPFTTRNKRFYEDEQTPLGGVAIGRYLYIGPPSADPMEYDHIICGNKRYITATSEPVSMGGEYTHVWAVLRFAGEV